MDFLHLISKIEQNHFKNSYFYDKILKVIQYIIKEKKVPISNLEIFQIYEPNIRILHLILQKEIIIPDDKIMQIIFEKKVQAELN